MDYYALLGPIVRLMPAESAHNAALRALALGLVPAAAPSNHPSLQSVCFGLAFKNPVGLAAGFDKNAQALDALAAQGFGFVEVGTVTPLPQSGNPRPRMFRLSEDEGVINRLGFNNQGLEVFVRNMQARRQPGVVGANIGKNKDAPDATGDYVNALAAVYPYADYVTVNISSPNTAGLRDLQQKEALENLMKALGEKRHALMAAGAKRKPVLYKIAPDLDVQDKEDIAALALAHAVDGLIVSNTTLSRPAHMQSPHKNERGGLSGRPLFALSTQTLRDMHTLLRGKIPLIGVGGIASAEDAYVKIKAGASLVQLYTALVYQGFGLVKRINDGLAELLERDGFTHITQAIGVENRS